MKTCLITGFEPFLDHPMNPTQEIIKEIDQQQIGEYKIIGKILPVVFEQAGEEIIGYIKEFQPDVVISLGLAAGRTKITPERVAINCRDGARDNQGQVWEDAPVEATGQAAYFSTLPIRTMVNRMQENKLPAAISNSAGTYVCNNVMYKTLHYLHQNNLEHIPAGFIHIPANHELSLHQPKFPSLSTEDLIKGIKLCVEAL